LRIRAWRRIIRCIAQGQADGHHRRGPSGTAAMARLTAVHEELDDVLFLGGEVRPSAPG